MVNDKTTYDSKTTTMKLRFAVNQAECFRQGIDCPKSIITVEVNPSELNQDDRKLIADRLEGIDVCVLGDSRNRMRRPDFSGKPRLIIANTPSFEGLMEAIRASEKYLREHETKENRDGTVEVRAIIEEQNEQKPQIVRVTVLPTEQKPQIVRAVRVLPEKMATVVASEHQARELAKVKPTKGKSSSKLP